MSISWYQASKNTIAIAHEDIPKDATFAERKKSIHAAYPFGQRRYWPYKAWLKAQREYLAKYGDKPAGPLHKTMIESPLEKQKRLSIEIEELKHSRLHNCALMIQE